MKFISFHTIILTIFVLKLGLGAELWAQEQAAAPIEVLVSADAVAQDLTASLANKTKLGSQQLSAASIQNFQDSLDTIPDLNWSGGTSRPRFLQIRGIGELEQYEGAPNSAVAFLVDDFDLSGLGSASSLFDIEEVNVLRGPQGFGFGPSALAGLVQLRSADPSSVFLSHGEVSAGNDGMYSAGAAISGPVAPNDPTLLYRVAVSDHYSEGFRDNRYLYRNDTNQRDEITGRAKLRWIPTSQFSLDLNLLHFDAENGYDAFAIDNSLHTQSDRPGVDELATDGAALKAGLNLENRLSLIDTATITQTDSTYGFDGDWGNNPFWGEFAPYDYFSFTKREREVFSNELRLLTTPSEGALGKEWNFLGGIYQQRLSENSANQEFSDNLEFDRLESDFVSKINAAFGAIEAPLAPRNSLTLGLRAENRVSEYSDSKDANFSPDENMWGALFGFKHALSETQLLTASISRGYKGGGYNTGANVPRDKLQFDAEHLWNFELGTQGAWLEEKLKGSLSLFYTLRREQQVKTALQDNPSDPLSFTYVTDNAARGRNIGSEAELNWQALPRLNLFGRGALLDAEFEDFSYLERSLDGRDQSHAPNWQYAAGVRLNFTEKLWWQSEVDGKDAFYFDDSHDQRSKRYAIFNSTLAYEFGALRLSLWARNLFNQLYAVRGFYFGDEPPDFPNKLYVQRGDSRQFGLTVSYTF